MNILARIRVYLILIVCDMASLSLIYIAELHYNRVPSLIRISIVNVSKLSAGCVNTFDNQIFVHNVALEFGAFGGVLFYLLLNSTEAI